MKFPTKLCASGAALATTVALGIIPATAASAAPSAAPAAAQAANTPRTTASSTITQVIDGLGTFTGSFAPTGFTNQGGQLGVTGVVTGTLTSLTGAVMPVSQTVTTTVAERDHRGFVRHPQPRARAAAPRRSRPCDRPQPGRARHHRAVRAPATCWATCSAPSRACSTATASTVWRTSSTACSASDRTFAPV